MQKASTENRKHPRLFLGLVLLNGVALFVGAVAYAAHGQEGKSTQNPFFDVAQKIQGVSSQVNSKEFDALQNLYDYDPVVVKEAFNVLGESTQPMDLAKLRFAASYSIKLGDEGFLSSDFSKEKLADLAFDILMDESKSKYQLQVAKALCQQKEETDTGEKIRLFLLSKVSKLQKNEELSASNEALVLLFCEQCSVRFLRKDNFIGQAFKDKDAVRNFIEVREKIELKKGLSVELFEMLLTEAGLSDNKR